jgi:hypothetical protein
MRCNLRESGRQDSNLRPLVPQDRYLFGAAWPSSEMVVSWRVGWNDD